MAFGEIFQKFSSNVFLNHWLKIKNNNKKKINNPCLYEIKNSKFERGINFQTEKINYWL